MSRGQAAAGGSRAGAGRGRAALREEAVVHEEAGVGRTRPSRDCGLSPESPGEPLKVFSRQTMGARVAAVRAAGLAAPCDFSPPGHRTGGAAVLDLGPVLRLPLSPFSKSL